MSTPGKIDRVDLATGGLLLSWLLHDAEEYVTMPNRVPPIVGDLPFLPEDLRRSGPSRTHITAALALMGVLMAAVSVDGYRTRGRSSLYQAVLYCYGMHGFMHLASALAARRYTSGSATALPVVLPFWLFANAALRADGVEVRPHRWTLVAFPVLGLAVHSVGYRVSRSMDRNRPRGE